MLLLSYAFPPIAEPEAALAAKRMGNLPGFEVSVLAAGPISAKRRLDHSLDDYVAARFSAVRRVPVPRAVGGLPFHRLGMLGRLPDEMRLANGRALSTALAMDAGGFDAVVSWSQWHSVHLVALALKRRHPSLPWLAHFSDPWLDNPFVRRGALERRINERQERAVLAAADAILFTSGETVELMLSDGRARHRDKSHVLPHAFEPALYGEPARGVGAGTVLRYLGRFYGARSPEPLFAALKAVHDADPSRLAGVRVELVGWTEPSMLQTRGYRALPPGLVVQRGSVDYRESLALMRSADVLLVVDAPFERSVFLPSKLVDYLGAERPILGITPPGAAAALIARYGGWLAEPGDVAGVARALETAITAARDSRGKAFGDTSVRAGYDAGAVGARMGGIVEQCIERVRAGAGRAGARA